MDHSKRRAPLLVSGREMQQPWSPVLGGAGPATTPLTGAGAPVVLLVCSPNVGVSSDQNDRTGRTTKLTIASNPEQTDRGQGPANFYIITMLVGLLSSEIFTLSPARETYCQQGRVRRHAIQVRRLRGDRASGKSTLNVAFQVDPRRPAPIAGLLESVAQWVEAVAVKRPKSIHCGLRVMSLAAIRRDDAAGSQGSRGV